MALEETDGTSPVMTSEPSPVATFNGATTVGTFPVIVSCPRPVVTDSGLLVETVGARPASIKTPGAGAGSVSVCNGMYAVIVSDPVLVVIVVLPATVIAGL